MTPKHERLLRWFWAGLLGPIIVAAACSPAAPPPADLVLVNAAVYTFAWGDPGGDGEPAADAPFAPATGWRPDAAAVAVTDGRIAAVGTRGEIEALAGPDTRVLDLGGAALLPGLIESHAHAAELGSNLRRIDLVETTPEEAVRRVAAVAEAAAPGEWIFGWGFDEGAWASSGYPDSGELSARTPDNPVLLRGLHGFATWSNRLAFELAGIDADTPDPPGGQILRRPDGSPTGVLLNRASLLMDVAVPPASAEVLRANLQAGLEELARSGYVAVHEAGVPRELLAAAFELEEAGELPLHLYAMLSARDAGLMHEWMERGPRLAPDGPEPGVTARSVKAYYDAALGSRGALMLEDYTDMPGHRGTAGAEYGFDRDLVEGMLGAGFQVGIHAIGDAGNRDTLDFLDGWAGGSDDAADRRNRIEHAQVLHPVDLPRLALLGIIASMQPPHAVEDKAWAEQRIGERVVGAYAWRSLRRSGADLIFNSDLPGSDHSIFYGLHAAVTRRDKQQQPAGGWYPEEALTPEEALRAYTVWPARAGFAEHRSGMIAIGRPADLTALVPDPLALPRDRYGEILDGEVLLTMVGGRLAHVAPPVGER